MANSHAPEIDYALVLADLQAKKQHLQREYEGKLKTLDNAMQGIELISIASEKPSFELDVSSMGVYEASVYLLEKVARSLTTDELLDLLIKHGKNVDQTTVTPTLYRAVKTKKDCKIKRVGSGKDGKWAHISWVS